MCLSDMFLCMRTTLDLDDQVLSEAKVLARKSGKTLKAVVEDALRERLNRRTSSSTPRHVEIPTFGGGGVQPGVDLDDSAGLRDLMDGLS